jgi:hypothetical protein
MIRIVNIFLWMALSTILFASMAFAYPSYDYRTVISSPLSPPTIIYSPPTVIPLPTVISPINKTFSPINKIGMDNYPYNNPIDYNRVMNNYFGASGTITKSSKNSTDINKSVNYNISLLLDDIGSKLDNAAVQSAPSAEQILSTFDTSIANGTLTGKGPGKSADRRRETFRKMIETTNDKIAAGKNKNAYMQLRRAYKKIDGDSGDFVEGEAAAELAQMILDLEYSLEQTTSLAKLRNRIEAAGDKITAGNMKGAYNQLRQAYKETDGDSYEFVDEGAAAELAQIILDLENSLGQTTSLALSTSGTSQNPLPPTVWLLGSGLLGLLGWRRFRKS